ncbi:bifunctional 5,10-methylenetetrahydrofolate dehydrogenase/5,10-methenyltetrahydrofolate cyclohydrolase [candidate division WWE3 bacterium]|jgi:methylenetetrahydrofolate dehydrogenase (NADP+)/methenyltetrahydrofolate cyclohydrolase|uniref:Bifunctional 5,10-methylenetetrahydrofolate dehydrogenase/5,10-methenyltetrahydrofolate cyclohydrolase n=1 Tax=candidate division WWE3 bacterium TaxID=2053526 RepID=A0A3A4ZFV3_UNCKA|nr:MAG: bifunctional 5,10-methylenetetrahydrofolate dehydrogenase/5,10-methenyltetrahydrofolate cyclohydrolase [candidate division WWE3 bacterium]
MEIFNGNSHAKELDKVIAENIRLVKSSDIMAIVQIGDNEVSESYVNLKLRYCRKMGLNAKFFKFDASLSDKEISKQVSNIFSEKNVRGGIIQLPLPRKSLNSILNQIPLNKDIDRLSSTSWTQSDTTSGVGLSPVVRAFKFFLNTYSIDIHNISIKIIGRGPLVGVPIEDYLLSRGVKPGFLDSYVEGIPISADLVVTSTGIPNLIKGSDIQSGCDVIDFGSAKLHGKTVGDLDLNSGLDHLARISPSPGGMGPLVIRFLVLNYLGVNL